MSNMCNVNCSRKKYGTGLWHSFKAMFTLTLSIRLNVIIGYDRINCLFLMLDRTINQPARYFSYLDAVYFRGLRINKKG